MNKLKLIFNQTLMISTGILFGLGIQAFFGAILSNDTQIIWDWYTPFSIVFTGFLCSIPSVFLTLENDVKETRFILRLVIHFITLLGVVSLCSKLFHWYSSLTEYLWIVLMYVVIYFFVWVATYWLAKNDENKINKALKDISDIE